MLNTISEKFHKWSQKGWLVLVMMVVTVLFMGYIMPMAGGIMAFLANKSVMPLDLMFFYTPEQAYGMIENYGADARNLYIKIELSLDILYPAAYTLFFGLALSWLFRRAYKPESKMQKWNAFPVSTWVLDLFENAGIATMVGMYPAQPAALAWITMLLGSLKWFSLVGTVVLLLTGVFMAIKNRFAKN